MNYGVLPTVVTFKMFALVKCLLLLTTAVAVHGFNLEDINVVFHVFTRTNPQLSEPLLASLSSIRTSEHFSPDRDTVVCVHSEDDSVGGNYIAFMAPAHLAHADVNLVAVDWSVGAEMYSNALGNSPQVGQIIAQFINILINDFGYSASRVKLVGVGLGGHIVGIAARNVNGNIPHIVALDPSFHGWTHHPDILNADDAILVEVLHATAGRYGYDYPLGDIDFYPNGGTYQNGCGTDLSCSHIYGYAFYAESITRDVEGGDKFMGTACEDYEEAITEQCSGEKDVHFGGTEDKTGSSGIYHFSTNIAPPFARG